MKYLDWIVLVGCCLMTFAIFWGGMYLVEQKVWKKAENNLETVIDKKFVAIDEAVNKLSLTVDGLASPTDSIALVKESLALETIKQDIKGVKQTIKTNDENLRSDFYWLLKIGLPATFIGLLLVIYGFYKSLYEIALKKATEEAQSRIMDDVKYQKHYRKILVLHKGGSDVSNTMNLLKKHQFQQLTSRRFEAENLTALNEYDAIILKGIKDAVNDFSDSEILDILNTSKAAVVKLAGERVAPSMFDNDLFGSATALSKLYPNLMDLLIYKEYNYKKREQA